MHPATRAKRSPLTDTQLRAFHEDGFVVVRDFFTTEELDPVCDEVAGLVDDLARRLRHAGRIADDFAGAPFDERLTLLERAFPGAATLIHIGGVLGPALARLWETPRLLDLVEQLIGPDIAGHPVWNLRAKTPNNPLATVPWHQDTAYMAAGSENTLQPTAWIPLVDATERMGTLQVVRGGHRHGLRRHRLENERGHPRSWYLYIPEDELPPGERVVCEMPRGSFLLFNQMVPHRSTENLSERIRWSVDLRWQRPQEPSGYEGIKEPVRMRRAGDAAFRPDWRDWSRQNRVEAGFSQAPRTEFDIGVIDGPWMRRWGG
jgi:hypothetical protein